jgi:rare lipoprotein A
MERDTAAHQRFAFGTWVRVDNLDNGKQTDVRINDRGPFRRGRIIDLSRAAARKIDMLGPGTAKVRLTVIAAPSPPSSSAASLSRWAVQVASFRDRSRALSLAARLEGEGRLARVEEFGDWTRVIVPCVKNSEPEAYRLLNELRSSYPDALIFSTENPPR